VDGDEFTGSVKVKLGPINLTYKGTATFVEKDATAHRAVLDARGRDARGNGTAAATLTATLSASGDGTKVDVVTDLEVTGKPAQFGRGVMVEVGNKLVGQFAECLSGQLSAVAPVGNADLAAVSVTADPTATAADLKARAVPPRRAQPVSVARPPAAEPEPIDLMASAGPAVVKLLAPVAAGFVLLTVLFAVLRYRRHR
jgi:carbon monoxide dehydrogenase subunit G